MIKFKEKLLKAVILILLFITCFGTYTSYAAEIDERYLYREKEVPADGIITWNMLASWWEILCAQHGTHIPSELNVGQVYSGEIGTKPTDSTVASVADFEAYAEEVDHGELSSVHETYKDMVLKTNSFAEYELMGTAIATPKQAYILCEAKIYGDNIDDGLEQLAWWAESNDLYNTANQYQEFVKKIADTDNVEDTSTYETYSHTIDGAEVSIKFPKIDEEKMENMVSFNSVNEDGSLNKDGDTWASNVSVNFDEKNQEYIIGPFSINYIKADYTTSEFGKVDFGFISKFDIYTDASSSPLSTDNWSFVWTENHDSTEKYPEPNEVFYIRMDYIKDATMLTGMDIEYKYLLAGGEYGIYEGTYDVDQWTLKSKVSKTETQIDRDPVYVYDGNGRPVIGEDGHRVQQTDEHGNPVYTETTTEVPVKDTWYWERSDLSEDEESQLLHIIVNAARWYETKTISMRANYGSLEIVKKAVDESGKELSVEDIKEKFGEDQYFDFKVTLSYADGKKETDIVTVKAGESMKKTYTWTGDSSAPTYTVEEIPVENEAWKIQSIEGQTGSLVDGGKVTVTAKNQIQRQKSNVIRIQKTVSSPAAHDELFKFRVTVRYYDGRIDEQIAEIRVPQGNVTGNTWESKRYTWYGENAPTYTVEEIEIPAGYTATITPNAGVLDGTGALVDVKAYNSGGIIDQNRIQIVKTLGGGPAETDEHFKFRVTITYPNGEVYTEEPTLTVRAGQEKSDVWTSEIYEWLRGNEAPEYKIEEIDLHGYTAEITPSSGKLDDSKSMIRVDAVNYKDKKNRIEIYKTIQGDAPTTDQTFMFEIVVTEANGTVHTINDATVTVRAGKTECDVPYISRDFSWKKGEEAPTYTVKEINVPDGYIPTITPNSGSLADRVEPIRVDAVNSTKTEYEHGMLEITKTIEGGVADKNEKFKFDVEFTFADGTPAKKETVEIEVKKGQTSGKARVFDLFEWEKGKAAPKYKVTEILSDEQKKIYEPELSVDGKKVEGNSAEGELAGGNKSKVTVDVVNHKTIVSNYIEINKSIEGGAADKNESFKFELIVTFHDGREPVKLYPTIEVPKGKTTGEAWRSNVFTWNKNNEAPDYKVKEIEYPSEYSPDIKNGEGKLDGSGAEIIVNAINHKAEKKKGSLTIEKAYVGGPTADTFDFLVKVGKKLGTSEPEIQQSFMVTGVKPGEKRGPFEFVWDDNLEYEVQEINLDKTSSEVASIEVTENAKDVSKPNSNTVRGTFVEGAANVNVKFTNKSGGGTTNKGKIKVIKNIETTEKITKDTLKSDGTKFEIEVAISGTFKYGDETYTNQTKVITKTLPDDNWEFETDVIEWSGNKAPTYTVREKNLPLGWKTKTINYSYLENSSTDSEGHNLVANQTVTATIVNELPSTTMIDLMFSMAGIVWVDDTIDEKNTSENGYYSKPNGVYDNGETLKENTEVTVYRVVHDSSGRVVDRKEAKAYKDKDNNELTFPIITKTDGKWDVPRISVPALSESEKAAGYTVSYDVEFAYDGENYEPTEFLAYQIEKDGSKKLNEGNVAQKAEGYRNASTSGRDKYAKDSMAIEVSNKAKQIVEVSGKTAIDANGDTIGIVTLTETDGTKREVTYSSGNAGAEYPTISRVNTIGKDGRVLDVFKATATTAAGKLTLPFDHSDYNGITLQHVDKTITTDGVQNTYSYMAVYNYCLNINLGLKERETVDIGLSKNLSEAKVVVNEKLYQYKYSGNVKWTEKNIEKLDKDIKVTEESLNLEYSLDLYKSDYYYRADMYRNGNVYGALEKFYKTMNKTPQDTEMDIYLTYNLKLKNTSPSYDVMVNSIDDYYDSSLILVRADEYKYLKTQTVGGVQSDVNENVLVASASNHADKWKDVELGIVGSDKDAKGENLKYNKMTANNLNIELPAGKEETITLTFKVNKGRELENAVSNSIKLGQKANVAEIASYTTYVKGTDFKTTEGKLDRDSAPGNVNMSEYNRTAWYEDDTFAAPRLNVNIASDGVRTIDGIAWEDNSKDKNTEKPDEKYNQQVGNGIKDNEDEKVIQGLTTQLVEKVTVGNSDGTYTEYDYIWPTDVRLDALGGQTIEEVFGFDSTLDTDENGAYKFNNVAAGEYVVRFVYGDKEIESQDYSDAKYYNGQDYKSSQFVSKLKGTDNLRADSYLNIKELLTLEKHKNTAVDREVRRLEVIEKSREITYDNSIVMAEYQDALYTDYYMFADTPKIDMNIENSELGSKYEVKNVDFALEERPITKLTLDKQIEEITLTTSDGTDIMKAKYNINYDVNDNGDITAKVTLDKDNSHGTEKLQALNRDLAIDKGFRYINVDTEILEAATITVKYRFTVLNTGEVDRTGKLADWSYKEDSITFDAARKELSNKLATYTKTGNELKNKNTQGTYVGKIYYHGAKGGTSDKVVTTTVRQLVDYIDNDVKFDGTLNATENTSWNNISSAELKRLVKDDIIITDGEGRCTVLDIDNVKYETKERNNLVVSVDNSGEGTLNNKGFIIELVPHKAAGGSAKDRASMNLTVTRYVGSDSDDLTIDNIAEIIKYNNEVGRRNGITVAGNQKPADAFNVKAEVGETVSVRMDYERDTSVTEVITLTPPTGSGLMSWKLQVIASITVGLVIIAGGIILIKKKVLK